MKRFGLPILLLLVITSTASAQWKKGDQPAPDSPDRKSVKGFGGNLIVVENPTKFVREWLKPETPKIKIATKVKRGKVLGAMVIFAGCLTDAQGRCDSEVDYIIHKPDGSLHAERKSQPLWKDQAPPAPNLQLGKAILVFRMEKNDPEGEYTVKAKVYDLNAGISFELETKFRLK